jgi:uncharacterized DUF497 family protein
LFRDLVTAIGIELVRHLQQPTENGTPHYQTTWDLCNNAKFEYDPDKSAANRDKHGIDFDEAQALWDDPYLIEAPANVTDEPRFLAVGMIGARHWTAVYTYRSDWVRIISVRRARKQEIDHYEID